MERADEKRDAAAPAKRPARPAATGTSAPKTECGPQRPAPTAEKRPAQPAGAAFTPAKPRAAGRHPRRGQAAGLGARSGMLQLLDRRSGRRCGSRYLLQVDHVFPYALGGNAEPDNLRLLCAAHHRYRHRHAGRPAARRNE